jgi:hypothetical protein
VTDDGTPSRWAHLLPALLVPVALLPDLAAALPLRTYYFRDFTATFYPLRLFAAREVRQGRFPAWNPYIFEGSFHLPSLYPPDLLHALWPSPVFVSWLLTLHLPLAALAAYWLLRELGASRVGAFLAGALYALGGFALSCLNLYVFLQALALAPFVAGLLRRAALRGGRAVVAAALVAAMALSTLAAEFVAQALLLGLVLGGLARPARAGLGRLALAAALGVGLAGLPLALTAGLLPETVRGAGFAREVALGNAVHPAVLLQALLPNLFGLPQAPAEAWWGGRFFTKGLPYFLSLYVGPLALATAALGIRALEVRVRAAILGLGLLGLWYALGDWGGLAAVATRLPLASAVRFPSKALLLPYLGLAVAAGFGADRLRRERGVWTHWAALACAAAAVALGVTALLAMRPQGLVPWTGVVPAFWPQLVQVAARDAAVVLFLAGAATGIAFAVRRQRLRPGPAVVLVAGLAVADLVRAGAGLNPQVHASFFEALPEIAALRLGDLDGGRVFSYGLDNSPAFREFLGRGGRVLTLAGLYLHRQILGPYANVIDRVETPEAIDLTSFVPRARELERSDYLPGQVGRLFPWLRNAAVTRVLSLDPLSHRDLVPLAEVAAGPPGLLIHVYGLSTTWPRAYVACRASPVPSAEAGLARPYAPGFDPQRDVALEARTDAAGADALPATCVRGRAHRLAFTAGEERYDVQVDASGYLVVRASFARGWRARVDGVDSPVLRANGKHLAVPLRAGRWEVVLRYEPPGWHAGLALTGVSALAVAILWAKAPRPRRRRA